MITALGDTDTDRMIAQGWNPNAGVMYGPVNGHYVTADGFKQWQLQTLAANSIQQQAQLQQWYAANPTAAPLPANSTLTASQNAAIAAAQTSCPAGFEWDGLASLSGCKPKAASNQVPLPDDAKGFSITLPASLKDVPTWALVVGGIGIALIARKAL